MANYLFSDRPGFHGAAWVATLCWLLILAAGIYLYSVWQERNPVRYRFNQRLGIGLLAVGGVGLVLMALKALGLPVLIAKRNRVVPKGQVCARARCWPIRSLPTNCVWCGSIASAIAGMPTNRSSDGVETQSIPRRQSDERRGSDAPLTLATAVAIFVAAFLLGLCFRCMRRRQLLRTSMAAGDTIVGNGPFKG